uniref:TAFII55 protein conserved region domain-containing protein n=1 Tax=Ditylenchus dipsaci TaxID=166011 RepID=A0A915CYD6_9BILA
MGVRGVGRGAKRVGMGVRAVGRGAKRVSMGVRGVGRGAKRLGMGVRGVDRAAGRVGCKNVCWFLKDLNQKAPPRVETDEEGWENHLIIRFPSEITPQISQIVEEDGHANDRLAINFDPDMRNGIVRFDKTTLPFKIYDLPCITEVMKTVDKKTLYKVGDLSQMIVCSSSTQKDVTEKTRRQSESSTVGESSNKKDSYQWPHGLTPPMKNARKCRFRKTKKKKYMDAPDVERELKRLLRSDLEAHSIRWEVVPVTEADKLKENFRAAVNTTSQDPDDGTDNIPGLGDSLSSDEDSN